MYNCVHSEPYPGQLSLAGTALTDEARRDLRAALDQGELDHIEFDAVVYVDGENANHYRFRAKDLPAFAASFQDQPFLRNHDTRHIEARDGTIKNGELQNLDFIQTIRLTTRRGMMSFIERQIDRFSIGWYYDAITCSVCNQDWLNPTCKHWPGRTYEIKDDTGKTTDVLCELIFENPRGKETSAVNAPAVDGTGILAQLCKRKETIVNKKDVKDETDNKHEEGKQQEGNNLTTAEHLKAPIIAGADMADWIDYIQRTATDTALSASGLPAPFQEAVKEQFAGQSPTPEEVEAAIKQQRKLWAQLNEQNIIQGMGAKDIGVHSMRNGMDDMADAINWLFGVEDAPLPPPQLRSLPNVYMLLTGDYDWHGVFRPDQATLANANTTTLADLAVNAMNKVIVPLWDGLTMYRWFEPLVAVQPNDGSVQNMQWIQFGGISNLSTVSEGGAYTEKTVADSREADSFQKYGNYVGITLEMIRNSRIAQVQAVTRALAVAAVRTRSAKIAEIFSSNSGVGPTLDDDSVALFHTSSHGNLATTTFSWTAWKAARIECAKQTELGSSKRQGLFPKFGLFPVDLYDDALVTFGFGQGTGGKPSTSNNDVNPFAVDKPGDPRPVPVMVPDWTDANDWAYLADPKLAPVIQMSYAQLPGGGRHPLPELFTAASETNGLLFTNDTLPIKVRDWFAYGVATYRGIGKRNVA